MNRPQLTLLIFIFTLFTLLFVQKQPEVVIQAATAPPKIFNIKVLAIGLNPVEGSRNLVDTYFSHELGDRNAEQSEDYLLNRTIQSFKRLSDNTINYEIARKIHITNFPPYTNGYKYTIDSFNRCLGGSPVSDLEACEEQKKYFDYVAWAKDNNICELADSLQVDEIWMMSVGFIAAWESFMIGPSAGFEVNGPHYIIPQCKKNYIVMNPSYGTKPFLHIYGHRIESIMSYITNFLTTEDKQNYFENFAVLGRYNQPYATQGNRVAHQTSLTHSHYQSQQQLAPQLINQNSNRSQALSSTILGVNCGNAHFSSNSTTHYDYGNKDLNGSSCLDWENFPSFQNTTQNINCTSWECTDEGWQEFWFSKLPHSKGAFKMTTQRGENFLMSTNWWDYILYPENTLNFKTFITTVPQPSPPVLIDAPKTCTVQTPVIRGNFAQISYSGNANSTGSEDVRLFIAQPNGQQIQGLYGNAQYTEYHHSSMGYAYKISQCQTTNQQQCNNTVTVELPNQEGVYQLNCDLPKAPNCTGNPKCSYYGGQVNCSDPANGSWVACSQNASDYKSFEIASSQDNANTCSLSIDARDQTNPDYNLITLSLKGQDGTVQLQMTQKGATGSNPNNTYSTNGFFSSSSLKAMSTHDTLGIIGKPKSQYGGYDHFYSDVVSVNNQPADVEVYEWTKKFKKNPQVSNTSTNSIDFVEGLDTAWFYNLAQCNGQDEPCEQKDIQVKIPKNIPAWFFCQVRIEGNLVCNGNPTCAYNDGPDVNQTTCTGWKRSCSLKDYDKFNPYLSQNAHDSKKGLQIDTFDPCVEGLCEPLEPNIAQ